MWSNKQSIAEYSVRQKESFVLYNRMLWDDLPLKPNKRLREGPQTPRFDRGLRIERNSDLQIRHPHDPRSEIEISFPVAIGAGSHPFPFRTRKLSLLPPMVLPAQVGGRVGRCRGLNQPGRLPRQGSKRPSDNSLGPFFCTADLNQALSEAR